MHFPGHCGFSLSSGVDLQVQYKKLPDPAMIVFVLSWWELNIFFSGPAWKFTSITRVRRYNSFICWWGAIQLIIRLFPILKKVTFVVEVRSFSMFYSLPPSLSLKWCVRAQSTISGFMNIIYINDPHLVPTYPLFFSLKWFFILSSPQGHWFCSMDSSTLVPFLIPSYTAIKILPSL